MGTATFEVTSIRGRDFVCQEQQSHPDLMHSLALPNQRGATAWSDSVTADDLSVCHTVLKSRSNSEFNNVKQFRGALFETSIKQAVSSV